MRGQRLLNNLKKPLTFGAFLLLIVIIGSNAIGISLVISYLHDNKEFLVLSQLKEYFTIGIFICPILLIFFPSYKQGVNLFFPYDPLNGITKATVKLILNFTSPGNLAIILFLALLFICSPYVKVHHLVYESSVVFISTICCLVIQNLIDKSFSIFLKAGAMAVLLIVIYITDRAIIRIYSVPLTAVFAFLAFYSLESVRRNVKPVTRQFLSSTTGLNSLLIKIYFRTRTIRINLIIAFLIKFIFLFCVAKSEEKKASVAFFYYKYLLLTSGLLFTYIHNNLWGYLWPVYKTMTEGKSFRLLFKSYCISVAVPVILDFIASVALCYFFSISFTLFVSVYIASLLMNILIGANASVSGAFEIKKTVDFVNFRSNTSIGYSLLTIFSTGLICYLILSPYYAITSVALIILIIVLYYFFIYKMLNNRVLK